MGLFALLPQHFMLVMPEVTVNVPTASALVALLLALLLLVVSGFVSGSEIAFFSLTQSEIEKCSESEDITDKRILELLKEPDRLLATILIANDFVNVGIVMLLNFFFMSVFDFGAPWLEFLILTVLLTFLLLLFGEVMPKLYSKNNVWKFSHAVALPLYVLQRLLMPFSSFLARTAAFTDRLASKSTYSLSVDELEQALELTDKKEIGDQKTILEGIIRFGDEAVKDIMTSRLDMVMLDIRAPYEDVLRCAAENAYSRIPVYGTTQDDIRGVLYIKDLIPYLTRGNNFRWQTLIRQPYFVPETKKIDDLLCDFQTVRVHMAIVVDEYGGVSGLITMEDIIEEIVGEINDEFDEPESTYERVDECTVDFDGRTLLSDFYKIMNLDSDDFEDFVGEADTLAGLLLEIKGEFPKLHEKLECNGIQFEVMQKDRHRLVRIRAVMPE